MHIANILVPQMSNGMTRTRTGASVLTDPLKRDRGTVVKLYERGNRQCLHFSSLL